MQATCRWEVISPFALRWLLERLPPSLCLLCRFCLLLSPPLRPSQKCRGERGYSLPELPDRLKTISRENGQGLLKSL